MDLILDIQYAIPEDGLPSAVDFQYWAVAAIGDRQTRAELVIRLVDENESAELNQRYRSKSGPTNILSFPFEAPSPVESDLLGDLVICAPIVAAEAEEQGKSEQAHWAHMVVHGILHLLGYDHKQSAETAEMESMETGILNRLGFADPYQNAGTTS